MLLCDSSVVGTLLLFIGKVFFCYYHKASNAGSSWYIAHFMSDWTLEGICKNAHELLDLKIENVLTLNTNCFAFFIKYFTGNYKKMYTTYTLSICI